MVCTRCGAEMESHFRFCSKCGQSVSEPTVVQKAPRDMDTHVQILGWILIGSAILSVLGGTALFVVGGVLERMSLPQPPDIPFEVTQMVRFFTGWLGFALVAVGAGTAAAGIGVLQYKMWGKTLAIIVAALLLFKIPVGTAIAIYTFWVLLSERGRDHFKTRAATA